jgi:hypothetical protein
MIASFGLVRSALVGIIAVGMIACAAGGDRAYGLGSAVVAVAKSSVTPLSKAVVVADYSPDIQPTCPTIETIGNVLERHSVLATLPSDCVRNKHYPPVFFILNGKRFKPTVSGKDHSDSPRDILGWELPDIFDADVSEYRVAISNEVNTSWLDGQIGSLKNSGIASLVFNSNRSHSTEPHRGDEHKAGENVNRLPSKNSVIARGTEAFLFGCGTSGIIFASIIVWMQRVRECHS